MKRRTFIKLLGGAAWDYLPHDHARSRAYRWGEDAIGGYSDEGQRWCLGVALWNERDPILKERLWRQRGHADTYVEWPKAEKEDHSVISSADASPTAAFPQARSFGLW